MYRKFNIEQVSNLISIYDNKNKFTQDINIDSLDDFFQNPSKTKLLDLLIDKNIDVQSKIVLLKAIDTPISYSSIRKFINKPSILFNIINQIDINILYTKEELIGILKYDKNRSKSTSSFSNQQKEDVEKILSNRNIPHIFSTSNVNDFRWSNDEAGADGILFPNTDKEILVYLRYGMSSGGHQSDRYRSSCSTAKKYPNRKFLFISDGLEAIAQWSIMEKCFEDENYHYQNALWTTVKLLNFIDFNKLEFK